MDTAARVAAASSPGRATEPPAMQIASRLRRIPLAVALAGAMALGACGDDPPKNWHMTDIAGSMPPLAFTMDQARDGRQVTAADFRGKVAMLYFGYTHCPDVCPTTLSDVAQALGALGKDADRVAVLFVTVDPDRDTLPVLKDYAAAFAPQVHGLRGTPDALAGLARRYRVAYSVTPAKDGGETVVTHSSAIFVFDGAGKARLVGTATGEDDVKGIAADLKRLLAEAPTS